MLPISPIPQCWHLPMHSPAALHSTSPLDVLYQPSQRVTDDRPIAVSDGHDLPGLIDEGVPGVAAVIDDVVEGFEDAVRQPVLAHELPDVFWSLSSAERAGSGSSEMLAGTFS